MSLPARILWLTWKDSSHPYAGGAETVNEEIAKRLVARGVEVVFIVGGFEGGSAREERDGYVIERVGNRWSAYLHAWRKYRRSYRGWADLVIDEVNTVPFFAALYAGKKQAVSSQLPFLSVSEGSQTLADNEGILRPAAAGLSNGKIPVLMFFHQLCREIWFYQLPQPLSIIGYLIEPLYLRMLSRTRAITVSDSTRRDLMRYGWRGERIAVISEGITMEPIDALGPSNLFFPSVSEGSRPLADTQGSFVPDGDSGKRNAKAPDPTVLLFGSIREMKRTHHALRTFELARDRMPALRLVVAGSDGSPYGRRVMDMIRESRHADAITCRGQVDEETKRHLLRTSHVLLSCAVKEGWGLTVTEANSQGTPAIGYDADGLRDSIRHGETGLLTEPTPAAMAAAIVSLLSDPDTYERLRRAGWEWSKTLTFDRATEDFVEAIEKIPLWGTRPEGGGGLGGIPTNPPEVPVRSAPGTSSPGGGPAIPTMTTHFPVVPLVSVIVPTLNSGKFLERCLTSIRAQTYPSIELIVVDNFSTDATVDIAKRLADRVYQQGPERSAQRNRGAKEATGEWVVFIDSDMVLTENVIADCVAVASESVTGVIIPEESFGEGFWAQCKKLERSFYVGVDGIEAARFIRRDVFDRIGGYDEEMVSGEDWDLSQRVAKQGKLARTGSFILHDEGRLSLTRTLRKKFYYARQFGAYLARNKDSKELGGQVGIVSRYMLFFRRPAKLFANPVRGLGMLFMKTAEFGVGGLGLVSSKFHN